MAYFVTEDGERFEIPDCKRRIGHETVGVFGTDMGLQEIWSVDLLSRDHLSSCSEFVAEIVFDHEPSENEILYAMSSHGLKMYDFVEVHHGYQLVCCPDDDEEDNNES